MGFPLPFDRDNADFSGITAEERLFIDLILHQADITVAEDGTEAAAATAVVMTAGAAPANEPPKQMVLDRPFSFWIRHRASDTPLFSGRIVDPSVTS